MIEVNLLPDRNILTRRGAGLQRRVLLVLLISTVVVGLDLGTFFLVSVWERSQVAGLVARQSELSAQSDKAAQLAADLNTIEKKTTGIAAISSARFDAVKVLKTIQPLLSGGVEMSGVAFDAGGGVSLSARAQNAKVLADFIGKLTLLDKSGISKISLSGLRLEKGGVLAFQVGASFQK